MLIPCPPRSDTCSFRHSNRVSGDNTWIAKMVVLAQYDPFGSVLSRPPGCTSQVDNWCENSRGQFPDDRPEQRSKSYLCRSGSSAKFRHHGTASDDIHLAPT